MSRVGSRNAYHQVSSVDKGLVVDSREDRHVIRITLVDRAATSRDLSQELRVVCKCLHGQFDDVCSSVDSQLGDHGSGYPSRCITDRNVFNVVINDEPGRMMGIPHNFI
ncbi:hypothetical protein TNCV_2609231 [Trichonephila clavipes]|nr:hypothetical protein TNCV_2609231 [Trichonephila clavipes]